MHLFAAFFSNSKHVFRGSRGALTHYNESVFSLKARPCVDGLHCLRESFFFFLDTTGKLDKVQGGHRFLCVCVCPFQTIDYWSRFHVIATGLMHMWWQRARWKASIRQCCFIISPWKHARWINNKHTCADHFMLCPGHFVQNITCVQLWRERENVWPSFLEIYKGWSWSKPLSEREAQSYFWLSSHF